MEYFVRKHNHLNKSLNVENNCYSKNQPTGNYIVCSGFLVQYVRAGMQNVFKWVSDNTLLLKSILYHEKVSSSNTIDLRKHNKLHNNLPPTAGG